MKKTFIIVLAMLAFGTNISFASFSDVSDYKENTFSLFINWLEEQEVVQGYEDGTFRPEKNISRAEFLKMLYETIGMQWQDTSLPFSDVPSDAWYTKYVKEAYATGIVQGYPDETFRPENPITFSEALKLVMEGFFDVDDLYGDGTTYDSCGVPFDTYSSVNVSDWYWKYIHVADELCMLQLDLSPKVWGDFNPSTNITRGDMAALLYIAKAVKDNGTEKYNELSMFPADISHSYKIKIIGGEDCISKTNEALDLLKEKAKTHYDTVVEYVGIIECAAAQSGMDVWATPPKYQVGEATMNAGTIWYAGTIAHDACHSQQYSDYLSENPSTEVPSEIYSGKEAEAQCLDVQYDALSQIGATQETLDYVKTAIDSEYWNVDYEDRWW